MNPIRGPGARIPPAHQAARLDRHLTPSIMEPGKTRARHGQSRSRWEARSALAVRAQLMRILSIPAMILLALLVAMAGPAPAVAARNRAGTRHPGGSERSRCPTKLALACLRDRQSRRRATGALLRSHRAGPRLVRSGLRRPFKPEEKTPAGRLPLADRIKGGPLRPGPTGDGQPGDGPDRPGGRPPGDRRDARCEPQAGRRPDALQRAPRGVSLGR